MMKNAKEKWIEYALYIILFVALVMCLYFIFISSSLSQRILACSLIVTIIIGGFINMWKIFHSSDKLDDISNNLGAISNNLESTSNKLADLSNVFDDLINLKKKDTTQTKDIEEQRRKDKERYVTEPLKKEFEKFLSHWGQNKKLLFEKNPKKIIFRNLFFQKKLPWMEIESIWKKSKIVIDGNKNILRVKIENEAIGIADNIIELSKKNTSN